MPKPSACPGGTKSNLGGGHAASLRVPAKALRLKRLGPKPAPSAAMAKRGKQNELQFLYLIASGNNDSVYKVGISVDPKARLEQIKHQYRVPKAYIIETMDVPTRQEVLAIESALHSRFDAKKSQKYGGREFFKLSQEDLEWLRRLYREKSNDFAQAKAFYALTCSASELAEKAREMERERQSKIDFNRRNGKTYNTKPSGDLKRYNDLNNKIKNSHLGERFSIKTIDHPAEELRLSVSKDVAGIINTKTKNTWLHVAGVGFLGGLIIGGSCAPNDAWAIGLQSAAIGAISGAIGQSSRRASEKTRAMKSIEEAIDSRDPGLRGK
jgi:hypothetical protein